MAQKSKFSRKQIQELFDLSRSKIIQLEQSLGWTRYFFDSHQRKVYYDIREVEGSLKPQNKTS